MGFDADTGLSPGDDGALHGAVVQPWWTPRGPLGGYVMAIVLRALVAAVDDDARRPRSLTVHFLRPPNEGPVVVRPVVERVGRSLTTATARLEQDGRLLAIGLGAFSVPWPGPLLSESPIPDVDPPEGRVVTPEDLPGRAAPPFTGVVTMLPRFGALPFSGADRAEVGGWLGLNEERAIDALTVVVLADAWYPAPWPRLTALAPAPTIDLTVHFRAPLPVDDACSSDASGPGTFATASSRRTGSCGRPTARSWRSRASSGC